MKLVTTQENQEIIAKKSYPPRCVPRLKYISRSHTQLWPLGPAETKKYIRNQLIVSLVPRSHEMDTIDSTQIH